MAIKLSTLTGSWRWVGMLAVVLSLAGCSGGSSIDTYEVSGTVTHNEKPVANVMITFNPDGSGYPASGVTDAQGNFSALTTNQPEDGVAEGQYIITLSEVTELSTEPIESEEAYTKTSEQDLPFPPKYESTVTSDLKATVNATSEKSFTFTLSE
jgi:hypothetical protein